jgi:hypothetical protein
MVIQEYCNYVMAIEDIKDLINGYKEKIATLESEALKKEVLLKKENDEEYSSKFEEALSKFKMRMKKIEKMDNKVYNFAKIRKEEKNALKILKNEITTLSKKKNNNIRVNLKVINREKRSRIEKYNKQIKILTRKLKTLEAQKFAKRWKKWRRL